MIQPAEPSSPEEEALPLSELLRVFDIAAANLERLQYVWTRAAPLLPSGPDLRATSPEYRDLQRAWSDLLPGLPSINGWRITEALPDPADIGRAYLECWEISEPATIVDEAAQQPAHDLAEYRHQLNRERRRATRQRLEQLVSVMDTNLPVILFGVSRTSSDYLHDEQCHTLRAVVQEIERILGDTVQRSGRWSDLHRHLSFGEGHDWHDIAELDWPSIRPDIVAAGFEPTDPLPLPAGIDLGTAIASNPTAPVATGLTWSNIDASQFERLLFQLLEDRPEFTNVLWVTRENAPDRGRDLSADRVLTAGSSTVRSERVIIQAKHWLSRSLNLTDVVHALESARLWQHPPAEWLIIATSGRFTADAVEWIEQHNDRGARPLIEMWADSRLESLLSQSPAIPVAFGLR